MTSGLTLLAVKTWLKKAWASCKKYWQILLGAAIPIVLMLIFRNKSDVSAILDRAREDHEKEVDAINKSYEAEISARDDAQKKYFDTISKLEEKYKDSQRELDKKKRKEIKKILKDHGDNPEEITQRLSALTGFKITY